jgi:hypothetical protein
MSSDFDPYYKWLGIRPDEQPPNHYRLLAVAIFESDPDVISIAADQRMAHIRSFQTGPHSALSQTLMNDIAAARVCLLNPEKKSAYDESLRRMMATMTSPPEPPPVTTVEPLLTLDFASSRAAPVYAPPPANRRRKTQPWHVSLIVVAIALFVVTTVVFLNRKGVKPTDPSPAKATVASSPDDGSPRPKPQVAADENTSKMALAKTKDTPSQSKAGSLLPPSSVGEDLASDPGSPEPTSNAKPTASGRSTPDAQADGTSKSSLLQGRFQVRYENGFFRTVHFQGTRCIVESEEWNGRETPSSVEGKVSCQADGSMRIAFPNWEQEIWHIGSSGIVVDHWMAGANLSGPRTHRARAETLEGQGPTANGTPAPSDRSPIPTDDAQARGMRLVKEVYGEEYDGAKTIEQKRALARKLLMKAKESGADQTSQFLLLKLAKDVAIQAVDGQTAFEAIDRMDEVFQVDGLEMKCEVLAALSKKARLGTDHRAIARQANEVIDAANEHDRFDLATELAELAISEANAAHDTELMKHIRSRMSSLRELKSACDEAQQAVETLKQTPDDSAANLAAGRYYCFCKNDWAKGLPMLTRGSDSTMKELATKDLGTPQMPEDQVKIGDAWWELAAQKEGTERQSVESRAAYWYNRALPHVSGLIKDKIEKRLKERTSEVAVQAPSGESPSKLATVMVGHFMVGMSQRKSKERKIVCWEFRPDRSLWVKDGQMGEWTATDAQVRVVFSDKALGEASLRPKGRDIFVGSQIRANGETWICELQKVFVVAVWEHRWPDGRSKITCWSNGHLDTPNGTNTWERKGDKLILRHSNGWIDTCTLSPDGKSYTGQNQSGARISGKLISE